VGGRRKNIQDGRLIFPEKNNHLKKQILDRKKTNNNDCEMTSKSSRLESCSKRRLIL
jgi:hypothetical protein